MFWTALLALSGAFFFFVLRVQGADELSPSDTLDTDGEGNALALMDVICCEDENLCAVDNHDRYDAMYQALTHGLTPREREIIRLHYGLGLPAFKYLLLIIRTEYAIINPR